MAEWEWLLTGFLVLVTWAITRIETQRQMRRERTYEMEQFFASHPEARRAWREWCDERLAQPRFT